MSISVCCVRVGHFLLSRSLQSLIMRKASVQPCADPFHIFFFLQVAQSGVIFIIFISYFGAFSLI